jgi:hypothetical protein
MLRLDVMNFLLPTLLAGLIGTSIPILVHLLFRRRSRRVKWAAMQFFGEAAGPERRLSRWKLWLLMACRVGAIAAVAVALSRPRVIARAVPTLWLAPTPANIAIVIDHSVASTRIADGQSGFERSLDIADEILGQLRPTDSGTVVFAEPSPRVASNEIVRASDAGGILNLRQSLRRQASAAADSSIPQAIAAAERSLGTAPPGKNIILVLSPPDQNSWHAHDDALWQTALSHGVDAEVYRLDMPQAKEFSDAAVTNLQIEPPIPGKSHPLHVCCTVSNLGSKQLSPTVTHLIIDEMETESRPVPALATKEISDLEFALPQGISATGSHRIRVKLDVHDSLAIDDQARAVVDVLDPIPILIVDGSFSSAGDAKSSGFLRAALHPDELSVLKPKVVPLSELPTTPLNDFAAVIFNDCPTLPPAVRDELITYARGGRGVWFILGPRTQNDFIRDNLANSGLFPCEPRPVPTSPAPGITAAVKDPSHPILVPISTAGGNPFNGSNVRTWWSLKPTDPSTQTLVAAPSGDPLMMLRPEGTFGGTILVWTTSADGSWNNWNLMPNFVPLVVESALHLAMPPAQRNSASLFAGQPVEFSTPADHPFTIATLTGPDGSRVSKTPTSIDGRVVVTIAGVFLPGFYTLNAGDVTRTVAVNLDPRQLPPSPLTAEDVRWLAETQTIRAVNPDRLEKVLRPHSDQLEISSVLGIFTLAFLVGESAIAMLIARQNNAAAIVPSPASIYEREAVEA